MANEKGVWRTIGGRRVFIKEGQDLASAMKESGKFSRVARNKDLYKKLKEEKEETKLTKNQQEAGERLNKKAEKGVLSDINDYLSGREDFDGSQEDFINELSKEWGVDKNRVIELYREETATKGSRLFKSDRTNKPHKLGQLNENDEEVDISKSNSSNYFNKHEAERLEIAKDIAKELNPSLKSASDERIEKEARKLLEAPEGAVDKKTTFYTNQKGELERSTNDLKKWRDDLNKTSERDEEEKEKPFVQKSTSPFYPDREYSKEDLKRMEENGVRPMQNSYSGSGWEGVNSHKNLTTSEQAKEIANTMKKKYPDVKIARKSDVYSGGSSIDFNIMSSDKDLFVSDVDIDKMVDNRDFDRLTTTYDFERWANDNVKGYRENHTYTLEDQKKYAKETLTNLKKSDVQSVRGNEWYLSDYGKKVVSDLNTTADSYTYNDSDGMTDYFDHGTYMHVSIGKWNKPYEVNQKASGENKITNSLKKVAYKNYMKQHPNSKMSFEEFKDMNKK